MAQAAAVKYETILCRAAEDNVFVAGPGAAGLLHRYKHISPGAKLWGGSRVHESGRLRSRDNRLERSAGGRMRRGGRGGGVFSPWQRAAPE